MILICNIFSDCIVFLYVVLSALGSWETFMEKSSSSLVAWRYFDLIFQSSFDPNEEVAEKKLNETSRRMTSGKEIFVVGNRKCRRLKSSHEVDMWRDVVSKDKNDLARVRNFLKGLNVFYNEIFNDWMNAKFQKIYIDIYINILTNKFFPHFYLIFIHNVMFIHFYPIENWKFL